MIFLDAFMPNDRFVNSTLGKYDGDVYRRIIGQIRDHKDNIGKSNNIE